MKTRAFTLLEVVINLAIMGVVSGMVFTLYVLFSKNVGDYGKISNEKFEIQSFHSALKDDFFKSDKVLQEDEETFMVLFYDETAIRYQGRDGFLFRQVGDHQDSIPMTGMEFKIWERQSAPEDSNFIEHLKITSRLLDQPTQLLVSKKYYPNYR